ncbi:MAG TPA: hypothetical protein VLH77_03015 [Gammaproteobacteria bacterium]|nr:hypothetical protein [Gammaproteobacteria bacterium]
MVSHPSARRRVSEEVLDQLIKGLESGEITVEQARAIATETLKTLDEIEKHEDKILDFYQKLASQHPAFKLLYARLKGEILKAREISEYKAALMAIESGNVEEANDILKTAIEQSANETTEFK